MIKTISNFLIFLLLINFFYNQPLVLAKSDIKKIDISIKNATTKFDITNIKPGDTFTKKIKIINKGELDTTYKLYIRQINGSDFLYKQLNGIIYINKEKIYDGKIIDFKEIYRKINFDQFEEFTFIVILPYESGNEYQGLTTELDIIIDAKGNESTVNPPVTTPTNGGLPQTGESNPIWYYLSGIMLAGIGVGVLRQSLKGDRPRITLKR